MLTIEFHPGDGGDDAKLFADELYTAIIKYATQAGAQPVSAARDITFHRL